MAPSKRIILHWRTCNLLPLEFAACDTGSSFFQLFVLHFQPVRSEIMKAYFVNCDPDFLAPLLNPEQLAAPVEWTTHAGYPTAYTP